MLSTKTAFGRENNMIMDFDLAGKKALVVGGGRGIGQAIALVLAEAGAETAVAARNKAQVEETVAKLKEISKDSHGFVADVADSDSIDSLHHNAIDAMGQVDILVNCAGALVKGATAELKEFPQHSLLTEAGWDTVMETNLKGVFRCCRTFAPEMIARKFGRIINISSASAKAAYPFGSAYQTSKAGVNMLTKVLAGEWARYNVTVNAVGPGWFWTAMTDKGFQDPEIHKARVAEIPLGTLTDIRDVGLLAVYLASPAGRWMTGQVLYLDGGETAIFN